MNRSYKNTVVAILLACILTMAIGYSVLNARLNIKGTSNITSEFNIQVIGISEYTTQGGASTKSTSFSATSASFVTNLQAPGDVALYEVVIENKGTIAGYAYYEDMEDIPLLDFGNYLGEYVTIFIQGASKTPIGSDNFDLVDNLVYLAPGEKLYVYPTIVFNENVTSLPEQSEFSHTFELDFYQNAEEAVPVTDYLDQSILNDNPIVTSGNGLYLDDDNYYVFKSDGTSTVNNYIQIENKLWRIVKFLPYDETKNQDGKYYLIEDELTTNTSDGYSSIANSEGFYNSLFDDYSTLISNMYSGIYDNFNRVGLIEPYGEALYYVKDTELFSIETNSYFQQTLIGVNEILNASTNASCTFANLSSGGCKSWLTTNGDTYLYNAIYNSDKVTNTGKIAYLEDGKVIDINPQDTNYGKYKYFVKKTAQCDPLKISNANTADGSRENPYIFDPSSDLEC